MARPSAPILPNHVTISNPCKELPVAIFPEPVADTATPGASSPATICLINQKGGCGKSSTCFHLAGALAAMDLRVLLVDADPQGSLSQGFFGSAEIEALPAHETLAAVFDDDGFVADYTALARPTAFDGIDIIPANQHLARHNLPSAAACGLRQYAARDLLENIAGYDIVLLDCPPNLYLCSWNAMVAAEYVIIPVPPEDFGTQGLRTVHQAIDQARQLNPALRRLGHLVTRYDRRLLVHQSYEERLRKLYRESVLDTLIPEAAAFKVALACRQPVNIYSRACTAAKLTTALAREILDRIALKNAKRIVA